MSNKLKINDQIESRNHFENIIESYLHLNGWGRKFILVKGSVRGRKNSLIEVKDPITAKKILGNVARLISYVLLFPLPLFSLAVRSWQRNQRQITLNPFQGDQALEQKYQKLAQETINAPFFPVKTLADKVNYRLVTLSDIFSDAIYQKLIEIMSEYKELAPEALTLFTQSLTTGRDVGGFYEKHLLTLKFLKSDVGAQLIPKLDRVALSTQITTYLKEKLVKATQASEESRQETIQQFLSSLFPANTGTLYKKELIEKEKLLAAEFMQEIFTFDPTFWHKNIVLIEKIANSKSSFNISHDAIENAKLFLNFLKENPFLEERNHH